MAGRGGYGNIKGLKDWWKTGLLLFFKQKSFNESKDNSQIGQILKKFLAQYGENKTAEQQKEITKIIIMKPFKASGFGNLAY